MGRSSQLAPAAGNPSSGLDERGRDTRPAPLQRQQNFKSANIERSLGDNWLPTATVCTVFLTASRTFAAVSDLDSWQVVFGAEPKHKQKQICDVC